MQFFPTSPTTPSTGGSGRAKPAGPPQADAASLPADEGLFEHIAATSLARGSQEPVARVGPSFSGVTAGREAEAWLEAELAPARPGVAGEEPKRAAWPLPETDATEESAASKGEREHYVPLAALGLLGSLPDRPREAGVFVTDGEPAGDPGPVSLSRGGSGASPEPPAGRVAPPRMPGLTGAPEAILLTGAGGAGDAPHPPEQRDPGAPARDAGGTPRATLRHGSPEPTTAMPARTLDSQSYSQSAVRPQPGEAAQRAATPAGSPAAGIPDWIARSPGPAGPALPDLSAQDQGARPRAVQSLGGADHRPAVAGSEWRADATRVEVARSDVARFAGRAASAVPAGDDAAAPAAARLARGESFTPATATGASILTMAPGDGRTRLTFELAAAARETNARGQSASSRRPAAVRDDRAAPRDAALWPRAASPSPAGVTRPNPGPGASGRTEQLPPTWDLAGQPGASSGAGSRASTPRPGLEAGWRSADAITADPGAAKGAWNGSSRPLASRAKSDAGVGHRDAPRDAARPSEPGRIDPAPAPRGEQPAAGEAPLIASRVGTLAWALRGQAPRAPAAPASALDDAPAAAQAAAPASAPAAAPAAAPDSAPDSAPALAAQPEEQPAESAAREPGRTEQPWWLKALARPARAQAGLQSGGERVVGADARPVDPARAGQPRNESAVGGFSHGLTQGLTEEPAPRPSHPGTVFQPLAAPGDGARVTSATMGRPALLDAAWQAAEGAGGGLRPYAETVSGQTVYWIRASLRAGRRETAVTLDPPQLGRLRISLVQNGPLVTARIRAELPEVESLLREGSERIRERLSSQGVRVDALVIEAAPARAARVAGAPEAQPHAQDRPDAETASQGGQRHPQRPTGQTAREEALRSNDPRDPRPPARGSAASAAPAARQSWAGLDVRA